MLALAWPLFWLMHHPLWGLMLAGQLGFAVLLGPLIGALPATMAEAFPARVRVSAIALSFNLCWGLLGGTAPMLVTSLLAWSHDPMAPAYYLTAAAAVSVGVLLSWRDTVQVALELGRG